ncbi:MAG: hypothetical protein E7550_02960 [Ruminococcaceae bacterium]|nr:hypothetical protein [Oscillospiraceae bacterium]
MAYIMVDYNKFAHAADSIEAYITKHKSNVTKIDDEIVSLSASWQGADYLAVKREWNEMKDTGSTSANMIKDLENYSSFLRMAGKEYKKAQGRALERAGSLPRW